MNPLYRNEPSGSLPDSWYLASAGLPELRPSYAGDTQTDVCVIGAGYTGLSAAYHLAQAELRVTVLDAHRVGFGASGRNGGQVLSGYNTEQRQLAQDYGHEKAGALLSMSQEAKTDI